MQSRETQVRAPNDIAVRMAKEQCFAQIATDRAKRNRAAPAC